MRLPRIILALLRRTVPEDRLDDVLGDLAEVHERRIARAGVRRARIATAVEALSVAFAAAGENRRTPQSGRRGRRARVPFSLLDLRLGVRMLLKYPGLTLVGGLAIAFAVWVGAGTFEFVSQVVFPRLGLPDGDRIVGLQVWDATTGRIEPRVFHDLRVWREGLATVEHLGASVTLARNLDVDGAGGEPIEVAAMSAAGFRVARETPLLGRTLTEADERPGAPPVLVVGYALWRTRFGADPAVVGRTVRVDGEPHTVVGVMPEGYGFPVHHEAWTALPLDGWSYGPREGPPLHVFGKLAPGATVESTQAELVTLGRRLAADFPLTHEQLRPEVRPYAKSVTAVLFGGNPSSLLSWALLSINLALVLLLVLVCANVALLMFARAAAREGEMAVRNALGASRGRIIAQLFAEALVLAALGTMIGLAATGAGLRWGLQVFEGEAGVPPFWVRASLSPATIAYACGLAVVGAAVAGVIPGLKVTRHIGARLKAATPGGGGGMRFGGIWTAVIVLQVAATVTFPATAFFVRRDVQQIRDYALPFDARQYVGVRLDVADTDPRGRGWSADYGDRIVEVARRAAAQPEASGVTFASRVPRMYHPWNQVEVLEGAVEPRDERGHRVSSAAVALDWFDVMQAPLVAGRAFHSGDLRADARTVIVNQPFVDSVLGGRTAIGRHIRYVATEADRHQAEPGPWLEIVGVAPDLGMQSGYGRAGIYHPAEPGDPAAAYLVVRVRGDAATFMPTLRSIANAVDPALRLHDLMTLDHVMDGDLRFYDFWFRLTLIVSAIALVLSLAGIYAVVAFTVAQRTREIGIRVALGAEPRRIASAILRRPLTQVALGIGFGGMLTAALSTGILGSAIWPTGALAVAGYATLMMGVCLLACVVPTRRALRVEPTEAMRTEG